jgi:ketosteroid isomerase-like protein
MGMADPKKVLENVFAETAKGNGRPFIELLAEDVTWEIIGSTEWSRTFHGKASVVADLLRPLGEQFQGPNTVEATRFIADGNVVAVEGRNLSTTKRGVAYPNRYCWIFEMRADHVVRVIEYCDTALVDRVLVWPGNVP